MIIPFSDYTPDLPALGNTASTIKNVIPHPKSYKQLNSLSAYSSALTAYCRGAFTGTDTDGNVKSFSGDAASLYRLIGVTFTDSSKVGGYSSATDSYWEFAQFGNSVIATNFDDAPQTMTMTGTTFADLTGTPPRFRHLAVGGPGGSFLMVGNTFDSSDSNVPYRVRWPGIGTITSWTVSAATQADFQDLSAQDGWVQAITGGEYFRIYQERSVWRAVYVGSPVVFQFDKIEGARGCFAPRAALAVGSLDFYLADDGFYVLAGGQSFPIGSGKIDKTFLSDLNDDYLYRVTVAAIPDDKVIIWSYPGSGSTDGTPNKCLLYNWDSKKWCAAEFNHELIYRAQSIGVTLEELDALFPSGLDSVTPSLDSKVWMGGKLQLAAFDTSHRQAFFTGTALATTLETGEVQLNPGRSEVTEVTALVDGGTHTVQVGTRETQASTVTWGSVASENASGVCPVRSNSRYHRFRVNNTGSFTDAQGVDVVSVPVGQR